jgi:hypothetical protein
MLKSNYDLCNSDVDTPREEAKQGRLTTKIGQESLLKYLGW